MSFQRLAGIRRLCETTFATYQSNNTLQRLLPAEAALNDFESRSHKVSSTPKSWSSVSLYDLVKKHYPSWRPEIQEQRRLSLTSTEFSTVTTGSIYRTSPFFQRFPDAACLALYTDGATLGDMSMSLISFQLCVLFLSFLIVCRVLQNFVVLVRSVRFKC